VFQPIHLLYYPHSLKNKIMQSQSNMKNMWSNVETADRIGRLMNFFDICQPITAAGDTQLTNESACILLYSIYQPS